MHSVADWNIHKCFYLELEASKLLWPTYNMKLNETQTGIVNALIGKSDESIFWDPFVKVKLSQFTMKSAFEKEFCEILSKEYKAN